MSWQTYVDDHLMCGLGGGQTLVAAAIIGHGGSVWALSASFPQGAAGVILEKTAQTIIIGVYDAILPPGEAAAIIGKLADYFLQNGY